MKDFLDDNFLLQNQTSVRLYHEFAKSIPIIDYHTHLPIHQISSNFKFQNITEAWLSGDHYKWRAMRINGVDEKYITGDSTDIEKFHKWSCTVPYTLRNPLYHWTHLELQRYFNVKDILNENSSKKIYEICTDKLMENNFSVQGLLKKMNVKVLCTTDDPLDNLESHFTLFKSNFEIKVFPTFRPDKAIQIDEPIEFNNYLNNLERISNRSINSFIDYFEALKSRHDYFALAGCTVSDHGLEYLYTTDYSENEIRTIFNKVRSGRLLSFIEIFKFKACMLYNFAIWNWEKGWVQQYHLGAFRNNNLRLFEKLGPDTGWDSIGDFEQGSFLAKFLGRLDKTNQLAKTILYNLNPADNELFASMSGNFNDGSIAGKVQYGSAWWFLDQKDGMVKQLNALSNMGLLSRFIGMLTDSRSFLSYPRHEYFRRILCNLFGLEIEKGELPNDIDWIGKIIQDICYYNAAKYFNWEDKLF